MNERRPARSVATASQHQGLTAQIDALPQPLDQQQEQTPRCRRTGDGSVTQV